MDKRVFVFRSLILFIILLLSNNIQAITFAERYHCDTLFHMGTAQQLQNWHDMILKDLSKLNNSRDNREAKAHLYALLCECTLSQGHYKNSLEYAKQAEKIYKQLISESNKDPEMLMPPDYAQICHYIARLNYLLMTDSQIQKDYNLQSANIFANWVQRVVATKDAAFISQHKNNIDYIEIPIGVGELLLEMSGHDYVDAARSGEEVLEIIKKNDPDTGTQRYEYNDALILLANVYLSAQDYELALHYTQEALTVIERSWGNNNPTYAHALYTMASIYYQLHNLDICEEYLFRCIDLYEKTGHTMHAEYADALELLGHLYVEVLIIDNAQEKYDKALDIIKKTCGEDCFHVYLNRCYAANLLPLEGRYQEAVQQVNQILQNKTFHSNLSGDHSISAMTLLMEASRLCGDYQVVIDEASEAEEILKIMDGVGQSEANNLYIAIGRAYQAAQRYTEACVPFQTALNCFREMARRNFAFLSEEQRRYFWNRDKTRFESILQQNQHANDDAKGSLGQLLYNASLLQKGMLLNASVNMAQIIEKKGPESLKRNMHQLQLMMQSNLHTPEEQQACRQLEQQIQNEARKYGDFMEFANYTWQDIQKAMRPQDVAIEFVSSQDDEQVYVSAELLKSKQKNPKHIFLFSYQKMDEPTIDQIIIMYVQAIRQKIIPLLNPGDYVYFSPVGELYQLPIEYIEVSENKRMDEVYHMYRVSSTRELITKNNQAKSQKNIVLFGGLNYNSSLDDMELQASVVKEQSRSQNKGNSSSMWTYLPGTLKEVQNISTIMQSGKYQVSTFTQEEGVEEQFKALSETHTGIIHIATHGFYESTQSNKENAGLIFAGANNFWTSSSPEQQNIDDGVLTTTEIANLNLIGTDLIVLSACQTGLGRVSGEGLFGLQRAFKKAGVQSILMSLWEVDDEATQVLMTAFYQYLKDGNNKRDALRKAQEQVRQKKFLHEGKMISGEDLYFWGGFILID